MQYNFKPNSKVCLVELGKLILKFIWKSKKSRLLKRKNEGGVHLIICRAKVIGMETDQGGTWQSSRMTDICRDSVYDRVGITNQ